MGLKTAVEAALFRKSDLYRFPANERVAREAAGLSPAEARLSQIDRAIEDLYRARSKAASDPDGALKATVEAVQDIEGMQRMSPEHDVGRAFVLVKLACLQRGEYD